MTDDLEGLDRRLMAAVPSPGQANLDAAWGRLRRRMETPPPRPGGWLLPVAAGAAIAALLVFRPWAPRSVELVTGPGEQRTVTLSDGSSVALAPGTTIRHRPALGNPRRVELDGEAWFEVVADSIRPFLVVAGRHEVRVLGTSFGVRADQGSDSVVVTVASGRVAFRPRGGSLERTRILGRGEGAVGRGDAAPVPLPPAEVARLSAWHQGELRFEGTPLAVVVRELERRFGLRVTLAEPALGSRPVTGTLGLDSADRALEALALTLDLALHWQGQDVQLRPR